MAAMAKYGKFQTRAPKKRKKWGFPVFMILYALVVLGAAAWGLSKFLDYMEAYEGSRIKNIIDAYMEQVSPQYVCDRSGDLIGSIDHNLQSEDACRQVILDFLSGGITYARKSAECTDTRTVYVLRSGGQVIGEVELVPQGEPQHGFTPWAVSRDSFDLSFLVGETASITVDHTMQVYAGETLLDGGYITESELKYEAVEDFYGELELPYKLTYAAGPILGQTELRAVDANGNAVTVTQEADLDPWLNNCAEEVHSEVDAFNREFIHRYVRYLTSRRDNRQYNLEHLLPLLVDGSDLKKRVSNAYEGLEFGQSQSDTIVAFTSNYIIDLGNDKYLCDVTYEVDSLGRDGELHRSVNNAWLFLVRADGGLKAERLLSY
jgi:hypothetical protein